MTHQDLQKRVQKEAAKHDIILFTNRVAKGWVGVVAERSANAITLHHPRPIEAGFGKGTSDLIGASIVTITPEMVGQKVAVFTAVEIKVGADKLSPEQRNFLRVVKTWGGISLECRNEAELFDSIRIFNGVK